MLLGVGGSSQAELGSDRPERLRDEDDVIVEADAEAFGTVHDVVPVDSGRERRLLQFLAHRAGLERLDPVRADEPAGVDEAGELVAREQGLLQHRVARQVEMLRVGEDRLDHDLGISLLTQDLGAVLRMLVERRVHLPVEVVEERSDPPELLVLAEAAGVRARRRLDGETVASQRLVSRVAREGCPGVAAGHVHRVD